MRLWSLRMPSFVPTIVRSSALALAIALVGACSGSDSGATARGDRSTDGSAATSGQQEVRGGPVLEGATVEGHVGFVTAMTFLPDGRMVFATIDGRLMVKTLTPDDVEHSPAATQIGSFKVARGTESGLLGVVASPDFATSAQLFIYYIAAGSDGKPDGAKVHRVTFSGTAISDERTVLDLPAPADQEFHFGGGLTFGPDGNLWMSFGDGNHPVAAQDPSTPNGKILRFAPDGSVPPDNPIPGSRVFAYGLRNGFGIAFAPGGAIYAPDNGESCDDKLFRIEPGGNYGWGVYPYNTCPYPPDAGHPPMLTFNPTVAPAGALVYTGDRIPSINGHLLVCEFNTLTLIDITLSADGRSVASFDKIQARGAPWACRAPIVQGPDGYLYTTTDNDIFRVG